MKKCFVPKRFKPNSLKIIERANALLEEYARHNITITLRSLYYRFVAKNWLPNKQKAYKRLGKIIGDARLAGRVDWAFLEDRTRNLMGLRHYNDPQEALNQLASQYHVDMWANQKYRPEVWVEKDAVVGNIEHVCNENDVPFFSCRGYTSLTEMYGAAMRLRYWTRHEQQPYIIHLGDHDPSGIDMSRDICERIRKTFASDCEFVRLALNMDQVKQYDCPPNPAKTTDTRYKVYIQNYGTDSWELDALEPLKFRDLVLDSLLAIRDKDQWEKDLKEKEAVKARLKTLAETWDDGKPHNADEMLEEIRSWGLSKTQLTKVEKILKPPKRKRK